ncbi:MAG: SDR family oxidoreductase [Candidatus Krumholzibacteriia bacterium]
MKNRRPRALVTGGAGFIGSHLAEELADRGQDVVVLDNLSTGKRENLAGCADRISFVEGSITDLDTVRRCCEGVDTVYHQAALASVPRSVDDPLLTNEHNVTGSLNVFWAAHQSGVRRVVYAASSSVYGDTEVLPKDEGMTPRPQSPYAITKHVGELYGAVFHRLYGLETIGLRYFNVFGARQDPHSQYAAVVPLFITRFLAGEAPLIHGDGGQSRDFTYILNVVEANLAAAEAPAAACGKTFNIACGERITIADLCDRIRELLGTELKPEHGPPRAGDVRHSQADITLAAELMNYRPSVDLDEGLRRTVAWYRERA